MLLNNIDDDKDEKYEKYFTKTSVAVDAIPILLDDLQKNFGLSISINSKNNFHFIEPSCGAGAFIKVLKQKFDNIFDNINLSCIDIDEIYEKAILGNFLNIEKI